MDGSPGFGSNTCNLFALFRLAFATAAQPWLINLATDINSQAHYAKGTRSLHKGAPTACKYVVSGTISLAYYAYFSPFPHGTSSLSVGREYLVLDDGPPGFKQGFTCPVLLGIPIGPIRISSTGLSPTMARLSRLFDYSSWYHVMVPQPQTTSDLV